MKKIKLFILTIISLMIISAFSLTYATNMISEGVNDVGNGARNVGNDIKNGVSDIGAGASSTVSDIGRGVSNDVNNLGNDIRSGIDNNSDTTNNTNTRNTDTTTNTNPDIINDGTYTTNRVAYANPNDNITFLGMTMSRTSMTLLIVALAAIIVAILVFSYVSQDNDRYRDNS